MSTRKEKATKAQNKRQERNVKPFLADVVQNDIKAKSITPDASTAKPVEIAPEKLPTMNAPAMPTKIEANNPVSGIFNPNAARMAIPQVETPEAFNAKAVSTGAAPTATNVTEEKALTTWEQMLANQRKQYEQDKTDAVKMQKYYALTDALNAIGKMGGAAIGGAIGGDALGGAPNVGEYKESRGYLDAFERAKQANDRLRALDEKEFTLAYNKAQRDDERAYKAQQDKITREYNEAQAKLNREWQAEQKRIEREWQEAVAEKNYERQVELKKKMLKLEQDFKLKYQSIDNAHEKAIKEISRDIVKMQTGSSSKSNKSILFKDKSTVTMSKQEYESMFDYFDGEVINGVKINKDNFKKFVKDNPELVKEFISDLRGNGNDTIAETNEEQSIDTESPFAFTGGIWDFPNNTDISNGSSYENSVEILSNEDIDKKWGN